MFLVTCCVVFCNILHLIRGLNILIADHLASPSHQIWNYAIAEELLERGHNVTMLGPLTIKPIVHKNYTHLIIEELHENLMQHFNQDDFSKGGVSNEMSFFYDYCIYGCKYTLRSKGLQSLLKYESNSFDVILIDLTLSSCINPLIQKFNYPPTVGLTAYLLPNFLSYEFGNGQNPAYIPNYYVRYSDEMTFLQRLVNYVSSYLDILLRDIYVHRHVSVMAKDAFGYDMDSLYNLQQHVSLLLANWNPVLHYPQPITPNIIPVGGAHIKNKPLEKDLKKILDDAQHGVILFSLGTNIHSSDLSLGKRQIIIEVLGRLKETVIWKFETDISGLPKNVIVRKWIPQSDILAHPNVKLFISHAGGLSTIEAAYFGVPVLGMPFILDQHINIRTLVQKNLALLLDYETLTTETFYDGIQEMLTNPSFVKGWRDLSRRFRDQPIPPMDTAIFWIEYVARHNGSHFLDPKSRFLSSFVTSSMDIHVFFLIILAAAVYAYWSFTTERPEESKKQKTN